MSDHFTRPTFEIFGVSKDFIDGRLHMNSSFDVPIASTGSPTPLLGDTRIEY